MVFLKQFFTFINFRKTVRDLGYWIGGTLFFAGVAIALRDLLEVLQKD